MEGPGRIGVEELDGISVVSLVGEHDLATAPEIAETLRGVIENQPRVVVDLSEAQFIDSSVLRAITEAANDATERHGQLVLQLATAAPVERVLELSGLLEQVPRGA